MSSSVVRHRRIPRGSLTRDAIVQAAVELLRGESSKPLTMQRVAEALDTRSMSLYSHVGSRDDLLAAATDLALSEWKVDVASDAAWEVHVRVWCRSLRDCMRNYPLLVSQIARNGRTHPMYLRNLAVLIRALRRAGVDGRPLADIVRWIPQDVIGAVVLEISRPSTLASLSDEASSIYASLGEVSPDDRVELLGVLEHFTDQSLDDLFDYTVDRIIDAIRTIAMEPTQ